MENIWTAQKDEVLFYLRDHGWYWDEIAFYLGCDRCVCTARAFSITGQKNYKPTSTHGLTNRESTIVQLIGLGMGNKQVALRLGTSRQTVKNHLGSIYKKWGVRNMTEMIMSAKRRGLA